jgi:hypothetical protein
LPEKAPKIKYFFYSKIINDFKAEISEEEMSLD